jgi:hypothetical protein
MGVMASQNSRGSGFGGQVGISKKLVGGVIALAIIGIAGYFIYGYMADAPKREINAAGKKYVDLIVSGKAQDAYKLSSNSLQERQSFVSYTLALGGLTSSKPLYKEPQDVFIRSGKGYFFQQVDGLTPTKSGRTDGIFSLVFVNDGRWKVDSVVVR